MKKTMNSNEKHGKTMKTMINKDKQSKGMKSKE